MNSCVNDPTSSWVTRGLGARSRFHSLVQRAGQVRRKRPSSRTLGVNYHVLGNAEGWETRGCEESVIMSPGGDWHVSEFQKCENEKAVAVAGGYCRSGLHKAKISGLCQNLFRVCCVVAQLRNHATSLRGGNRIHKIRKRSDHTAN